MRTTVSIWNLRLTIPAVPAVPEVVAVPAVPYRAAIAAYPDNGIAAQPEQMAVPAVIGQPAIAAIPALNPATIFAKCMTCLKVASLAYHYY